jgi:Zn-dependent protease
MLRPWKLGSAFGIGIYVHITFWLLPAFILLRTWGGGPAAALYSLALVVAVFGCVVLHELGHALMARHYGIRTRDITLYPIGGVARLERMSERPWEELWIALAGPAVNVVIALALLAALSVGGIVVGSAALLGSIPGSFLASLMLANVILVAFNLLPAFPMDGGRVLRAFLAMPLGRLRATEIAATVGVVMAVLFGLGYLLLGRMVPWFDNPMLILVGLFVWFAGQQELAGVRRQEALRLAEPIDVLPAEPAPYAGVEPGFSGFTWDSRFRAWVVWRNGRPVARYSAGSE